jgi:hypothetical protein
MIKETQWYYKIFIRFAPTWFLENLLEVEELLKRYKEERIR